MLDFREVIIIPRISLLDRIHLNLLASFFSHLCLTHAQTGVSFTNPSSLAVKYKGAALSILTNYSKSLCSKNTR